MGEPPIYTTVMRDLDFIPPVDMRFIHTHPDFLPCAACENQTPAGGEVPDALSHGVGKPGHPPAGLIADAIRADWHDAGMYGRADFDPRWLDGFATATAQAVADWLSRSSVGDA